MPTWQRPQVRMIALRATRDSADRPWPDVVAAVAGDAAGRQAEAGFLQGR